MLDEKRIKDRLGELYNQVQTLEGTDSNKLAWAHSVLTIVQSICGPENFQVQMLKVLIKDFLDRKFGAGTLVERAYGILKATKSDFEGGYFANIHLQARQAVETDFLSQAHRLLEENSKDPAAMVIGAVLEDTLRQLCSKHTVPEGGNIESMNIPLRQAGVYDLPQ